MTEISTRRREVTARAKGASAATTGTRSARPPVDHSAGPERDATRSPNGAAETAPEVEPEHVASGVTRGRRVSWRHALGAGLMCFAVWLLLDAPTLLHSAEGSPLGTRRTVAIDILRPIAAVSDALGLQHIVGAADRVMGRTGSSVLSVVGPPSHGALTLSAPHPLLSAAARQEVVERLRDHDPLALASGASAGVPLFPLPTPTAADPLRVLSVGDSLGVDLGQTLVNDLAATGVVQAVLDAHIDTGLSRPDYFNWPAELRDDLARYHPQVVVVFLGANDPQNFIEGGRALTYGTAAWSQAYAQRVAAFMRSATDAGARVLWVGMPPMQDPGLNAEMRVLDGIDQAQAATNPAVTYLSSFPVLGTPSGGFAMYLTDSSGNEITVREPDGTHLAPGGAELLSQAVIRDMDSQWGLDLRP